MKNNKPFARDVRIYSQIVRKEEIWYR